MKLIICGTGPEEAWCREYLTREKLKQVEHKSLYSLMAATDVPDLFALITGLCAVGLILIPELVYVRDIYENGNARANTMFKLTYQA